jgi:hypothetical protein
MIVCGGQGHAPREGGGAGGCCIFSRLSEPVCTLSRGRLNLLGAVHAGGEGGGLGRAELSSQYDKFWDLSTRGGDNIL